MWSRIKSTAKKAAKAVKSVGKKIVNTAKKVVKTVVNTAKKAAKTIVNTVKGVAKTAKNAAKHAKQTYQSVKNRVTSSSTYQKITSRGSQFIRSVSNGVQKIGKLIHLSNPMFQKERQKSAQKWYDICVRQQIVLQISLEK